MRLQKIISVRENTTKLRGNNKLKRGPHGLMALSAIVQNFGYFTANS